MPERGECTLVVVPGGAEVWTSAVGRVQTPSRLGEGREHIRVGIHTRTHTETHKHRRGRDTQGQWHKCGEENGLKYV